jgi:hypothetical protein
MFSKANSGISEKQFQDTLNHYQARMQAYDQQLDQLEQLQQKKWYTRADTDLLKIFQCVPAETTFDYKLKLKFLDLMYVLNAFNDSLATTPKLAFSVHYYQFIRETIVLASQLAFDENVNQLGDKIDGLIEVITQVNALIKAPEDPNNLSRLAEKTHHLENLVNPPIYDDFLDNPYWRRFAGIVGLVVSAALIIVAAAIHPLVSSLVLGILGVTALALVCVSTRMLFIQHHPCEETEDDDEDAQESILDSLPIAKVNKALGNLTLFSKTAFNKEPEEDKLESAESASLRVF